MLGGRGLGEGEHESKNLMAKVSAYQAEPGKEKLNPSQRRLIKYTVPSS